MSIRLRLALWYGVLTALVLLASGLISYAFHSRGHYDDLDQSLVNTADHASAEVAISGDHLSFTRPLSGLNVALRLYDSQGALEVDVPGLENLPKESPQDILAHPAGPAFDVLAGLAPPLTPLPEVAETGAFNLFEAEGQRWRSYIMPVRTQGMVAGYIEAITSLRQMDGWMSEFRRLLLALDAVSLLAVFAGSWATAGSALSPIARMVETAQMISHSRDLSRRIDLPLHRDELHHLAGALNGMLVSIEEAYRAQQRFVSDASHELRAPLTAIQANLELLQRHPEISFQDQTEALSEASREAYRLTRLIADLLALARADAGASLSLQRVELDQIALEAVNEARHLARGQRVEIGKMEPALVMGNPDRLKQLFLILLDNAIKYTPPGGQVLVDLKRDGKSVEVTVRDSGVGISVDALPHIFERFYRADPARTRDPGGTGLGLPIAQWIVEQHEGHITIDSQPGAGTTVRVKLPVPT